MPSPRLHILPWDRPLLPQAAAWLARGWNGTGPLDLAHLLVIAPTRQSGRRLREALAALAAAHAQAVFPPRVFLPEELAGEALRAPGIATRHEALLAWVEVLRDIDLAAFDDVFPVAPPARNFAWASRLAREFIRLQTTLAENGLRMADVPARGGAFPEARRWHQLAALETRHDAALARRGLRSSHAARIAFAKAPRLPDEAVTQIVVLATPDPLPLAIETLENLARATPVDVIVFGPADEKSPAENFDPWGRPRTETWSRRRLALGDFEKSVHLCADPGAQAERIVACAQNYPQPDAFFAVGVADAEIVAPLRHGMLRAGFAAYDPNGVARSGDPLAHLLGQLADFAQEPAFATVEALARCPDVLAWLRGTIGAGFSPARLLAGLDELHARHLPATLESAREHVADVRGHFPELAASLDAIDALREKLTAARFPENIRATLATIFGERRFDLEDPPAARAVESAAAWMEILADTAAAAAKFRGTTASDAWELAVREFGESVRFEEKPPGAIELQGWLELLWEDAPHLAVAGLNDGSVPAAIVGDAFLPEALREKLGLKTNAARLARDAYLLQALAACRASRGRLDLLFGKTSAAGDPLRPSRLLLLCDDEELPRRVAFLFRDSETARPALPWRRAWQLKPRAPGTLRRVSVTAFRDYLACPFRFFLKHELQMQPVDAQKAELDARDFGTLCHLALEAIGRDATMRDATDAAVLRGFLLDRLEHAARQRYGAELSLPLLVQLESARQRLSKAAEVQAQQRGDAWVIERVEWKFEIPIGGVVVVGKIDRIDRNALTGAVRVVDYKTSDKPVNPRAAHVRRPRRNEDLETLPDFARFTAPDGEELIWTDLQLPLYRRALASEFGAAIECGYFNLPKASTETAIARWENYDDTWQAAAERCAEGIAAAVVAGRFWPPAELEAREDDFASLFHHGAADSVAWTVAEESQRAPR